MARRYKKALFFAALGSLAACAGMNAEERARIARCEEEKALCLAECDRAFEIQENSWDYAACTRRCRHVAGLCRPQ